MLRPKDSSRNGALYRDTLYGGADITVYIKCRYTVFLDSAFNIPIMRTSFFAGIAQLVERYLAKV